MKHSTDGESVLRMARSQLTMPDFVLSPSARGKIYRLDCEACNAPAIVQYSTKNAVEPGISALASLTKSGSEF